MNWLPESLAAFGPATLAALLVAAYLVLGEPFVGWVLHRRFEAAVDLPGARRWLYRRLLILEWGLVGLVVAISVVAPDLGAGELGVRWPDRVSPVSLIAVVLLVTATTISVRALRSGVLRDVAAESMALRSVGSLLPRTGSERNLFTFVAVTAGIAEEVVYRGFGIAVLAALRPSLPWWGTVALTGAAFGIAHAYQGLAGILTTGLLGCVLAAVYLDTGSLVLPVLLHSMIDLRFLAVPAEVLPRGRNSGTPRSASSDAAPPGEPEGGPNDTRPIDYGPHQ